MSTGQYRVTVDGLDGFVAAWRAIGCGDVVMVIDFEGISEVGLFGLWMLCVVDGLIYFYGFAEGEHTRSLGSWVK